MKPTGTYKIRHQREGSVGARLISPLPDPIERALYGVAQAERRTQRIVDSISDEIREGGERSTLRIRRVFVAPREIFRVEIQRPDLGYQRTTLLGRDALEALLECDGVQTAIEAGAA
jgi:hypothetical protein